MRKFILSLIIFAFAAPAAYAAAEFALPEPEWGTSRAAIAAKAQGELYLEEDDWLWYTSYDAYEGCIVETQYRFNANGELNQTSWHMRPQIESEVGLAQVLVEYSRIKEALLLRYAAPYDNQVFAKTGETETNSYPDVAPAPVVADIQPGTLYIFESRWRTDEIAVFLYVTVSEKGTASINVSFHNKTYE